MKITPIAATWGDDGTDCQFSVARAAAGIYDPNAPDVAEQKRLYRQLDPTWPDGEVVPRPPLVWELWRRLGYEIHGLHLEADLWALARRCVDADRPLIVWTYRTDPWGREFLHAELLVGLTPNRVQLWEQQRGTWHSTTFEDFLSGSAPVRWAGHLYLLQPAGWGYPQEAPVTPLYKSIMAWQLNHTREQTVEDWVETLHLGGIDCFRMKSHQALNWMANVYRHPLAPRSVDDVARQYTAFGEHGITYLPWCVPMGLNVAAEADLAIAVGRAAGGQIDVDLEIGADFWDTRRLGTRGVVEYFRRLKDAGLWVVVDTACFDGWGEALAWREIVPYVDRWLSQSYWRGFGRPYADVIRHDLEYLRAYGATEVGVVADARAPRYEMRAAAELAASLGAVEWSCWATDMATPETYAGFALVPGRPWREAPADPPDRDALWRDLGGVGSEAKAASETLIWVSTPGNTEVTEAAALGEAERIADLLTDAAGQILDLTGRLRKTS